MSGLILLQHLKILSTPRQLDLANLSIQATKKYFQLHYSVHKQLATNP